MLNKNIIHFFQDETTEKYELTSAILRIDTIHPIISGNKIFKLKYYLRETIATNKVGILTFGGYYSNHLVASAYAAKQANLESIGIVRGERPNILSQTLSDCITYNMKLKFYSRNEYDAVNIEAIQQEYPEYLMIQEGGYGEKGMYGAMEILQIDGTNNFDFIIAASGTGTMGAGLISGAASHQKVILISVLKNNFTVIEEVKALLSPLTNNSANFEILFDFHLGGYAKKSEPLFESMNAFYIKHQIPTDFVYTGKMIHAFYKLAESGFFPKKSKILLIHSGGLQGNRSLEDHQLIY